MFDFFRSNIKFLMGFLMLLIIPSFVLFGIEGYQSMGQNGEVVAKVGKHEITQEEWENRHRADLENLVARMSGLDRATLDGEAPRLATLERMVNERVVAQAVQDTRIAVTDQRLARELAQDPTIAALRTEDGKLDVSRYQELLRAQGMTPEMYESSVRADLARRQVTQGVAASSFVPEAVATAALNAVFERREVQLALFSPRDFRAAVTVSDDDVKKYYYANPSQFQLPEQVDVEYAVLDLDAVARGIALSEADVRAYYEQNNAALAQQEQRRASHILLTLDPAASTEAKAKVKAEAQAILAQLRQAPGRFAELAKTRSQDPGSAVNGGDLDFFSRGSMVKPFEDAVFALSKGQLSDVVESEFGYHIILLTDVRRPVPPTFETVRGKLEAELKRQQAQRQFAEVAESFSNQVYEQAESLAPVAAKLGLTVHKVQGVLRSGPSGSDSTDVLAPQVLQALFAEDSLRQKHNIAAVEVGPNRLVSARVLEHRPAALQPLEVVKDQVRERLVNERATALAHTEGQAKLAAWQAAPASAVLRPPLLLARNQPQGVPPAVLKSAFAALAGPSTAAWTSADLGNDGFVVVRVNRVLPRTMPDPAQAEQERLQVAQLSAQAETQAYLAYLRASMKTKVLAKKSAETTGVAGK